MNHEGVLKECRTSGGDLQEVKAPSPSLAINFHKMIVKLHEIEDMVFKMEDELHMMERSLHATPKLQETIQGTTHA